MKRLISATLLVIFLSMGFIPAIGTETREGWILPFVCRERQSSGPAEHTTECALEPECVADGFGMLVGGKFITFDDAGDKLALEYFQKTTKTDRHWVKVNADFSGEDAAVMKIVPAQAP